MTKNHNMGRKSHRIQDIQHRQNLIGLDDELGDQPTKPTVSPQKATKSSSEEPRNTK